MGLEGQIAWITGGGGGIGESAARELAAAGATVIVSGRRREELERVAKAIGEAGGKAEVAALDVSDRAAVDAAAKDILDRHGRIDVLVANAGLNTPKRSFKDVEPEGWDRVVDVNLTGVMSCVQAVLPAMRKQGGGLVVMISSWAGKHASQLTGPAYNATKHAVVALSHSLNMEECGNGIRSTVVMPGEVDTPILDSRPVPPPAEVRAKMLKAEDLGRTIRFVAEAPAHVCFNEILISPTHNRAFLGREL